MKITNDLISVGVYDKNIRLFEAQYPTPDGMAYNSYVMLDERIAVFDSVEADFAHEWLDNVKKATAGKTPDYLVVLHMEPDHSANIMSFAKAYPNAKIVSSAKAFAMMKGFFGEDFADRRIVIKDGDSLKLGKHEIDFISAPMVHWPEVTVAYDREDKILFSADGFGRFGGTDENDPWSDEARRYYIGIVGKYGAQVQALLKKLGSREIKTICSLHGPVLTKNLEEYIRLYDIWSSYTPEAEGIVIAYASVYGNTKRAAELLAEKLREGGCPDVKMHDLTKCDASEAVSDAFKYPTLVLASVTYNNSVFPPMKSFISHLTERGYKNRRVALIENGSWAPNAAKVMRELLSEAKDIDFAEGGVRIISALNEESKRQIDELAGELCLGYEKPKAQRNDKALFNIGYGLYVVTSHDGERDNGLIVNTVSQLTSIPARVSVTINKSNYSHHVIKNSGKMNVNCLSVDAPFAVFERFGFVSGRTVDKFRDCEPLRSENGLAVLKKHINAYMSLKVCDYVDLGTHGMFICEIEEARVLSDRETMTYTYYQKNVKPKPKKEAHGYVCTVCGYVHEEDTLPDDFVCPLCKHTREVFEKIT